MTEALRYRPDVDGLRGVAIIAGMTYHIAPEAMPGGFTAVDMFFVLSGFLITGIVNTEAGDSSFSYARFYERRVKRLLAPLLVMILASLIAGAFFLMPGEYAGLSASALSTLAFGGNFYFLTHTGYFDAPARSLPLLSTWSLGVEEQFYVVWPALLLGLRRLTRGKPAALLAISAGLLVASAVAAFLLPPRTAFYLVTTRAWQLLAGAFLSLLPGRALHARSANGLAILGALVLAAGLGTAPEGVSPLRSGLEATLGTALMVAGGDRTRLGTALAFKPLVHVGRISYGIYLWHWPILAFFRQFLDTPTNGMLPIKPALVATFWTILLADLSWRFVEKPLRAAPSRPVRNLALGAKASLGVALLALLVWWSGGVPRRLPSGTEGIASLDVMWAWKCPQSLRVPLLSTTPVCVVGAPWDKATTRGVVWGDSHIEHLLPELNLAASERSISLVVWRYCTAYMDGARFRRADHPETWERCAKTRRDALAWLSKAPDIRLVVFGGPWAGHSQNMAIPNTGAPAEDDVGLALLREGMEGTLRSLAAPGRQFLLIGQVPAPARELGPCAAQARGAFLLRRCGRLSLNRAMVDRNQGPAEAVLRGLASSFPGVRYLSSIDGLCDAKTCETHLQGELLYRDGSHLRRNLPDAVVRALTERLRLAEALDSPEA